MSKQDGCTHKRNDSRDALSFAGYLKYPMYPVSSVLKKIEWQQQWRGKTFQITFIPPFAPFASHKTSFLCHVATHSGSSCDVCRRGDGRRFAPTCAILQRVTRNASCLNSYCYKSAALAMLVFIGESSEQIGNS